MDSLDYAALFVLVVMVSLIGALIIYLAGLPGRVARKRSHPHQHAIAVGGWATLILGGIGWPFVLMWAYVSSQADQVDSDSALRSEIRALRNQVDRLAAQAQQSGGAKR